MGSQVAERRQTIKISSKRQITIPAQWYREAGFGDYALCTWTDDGILLQPVDVDDEGVAVSVLRSLVNEGLEGEDLIEEYRRELARVTSVRAKIAEAERDVAEGRVDTYENMRMRIRGRYGF